MTRRSQRGWGAFTGLILFTFPLNAQINDSLVTNWSDGPVNDCTLAMLPDMVKVVGDCDADLKPHGHWIFNYRTGRKGVEGDYEQGRKTGIWSTWDKNGVLFSETTYIDTTMTYVVRRYYHDGRTPKSETTFDADGKWLIQTDWDVQGRRSSYPNTR